MNWKFWETDASAESGVSVTESTATKSSARIQMALLVEMVRMLQEFQEKSVVPAIPQVPVKPANLMELERLGFTNTVQWKEYNEQMKEFQQKMEVRRKAERFCHDAMQVLDTLKHARKIFGKDTLLIRYDDFERLMDKYNLVCGTFDSYTGDVPLDKMADISMLVEQTRGWRKPLYINSLRAAKGYETLSSFEGLPDYLIRFPFVKEFSGIEATDFHGNDTWDIRRGYHVEFGQSTSLFICAPSKDMKKLERIVSLRSYNDPFICAHTDQGILVFTRWGEEADDAIVKKYEQINQILDGI